MKLSSARQLWHDAHYQRRESTTAYALEVGLLGAAVQKTDRDRRTLVAMDQALSGVVQSAISTLPAYLQCFGHWLYSPLADDDHREIAEELVYAIARGKVERMTEAKAERARYVAMGVLFRYRRQHQGGQSEGMDPMPTPEAFRKWLFDRYGVSLDSRNWSREWDEFIERCFDACDDLDRKSLAPVAMLLASMREAA